MRLLWKSKFCLGIISFFLVAGFLPLTAATQGIEGAGALLAKPPVAEEEKKAEVPTTAGPVVCDTCIPIKEHTVNMQVLWGLSFYAGEFSPNWRQVSAGGHVYTLQMPVKLTYGPTKDLETNIIIPFIYNWINNANVPGPNGQNSAGYAGIGDITTIAKYLVLEETDHRPAVSLVGGVGWPSGHASHLNPGLLLQDGVGTGSFSFITGVNLFKYVEPFLLQSNIWLNSPINIFKLRGTDVPQNVRNRENVVFNLAAEYPINKKWILLLEMYSTWTWQNPTTEAISFQSPTTLLGFLPGIEYIHSDKWAFTAGCAIDTIGKFGGHKITPAFTVYYNF